jgi:hypothetical protein
VEQNATTINDGGRGKSVEINCGKNKNEKKSQPPADHSPFAPIKKFIHSLVRKKHERGRIDLGYPTASLRGAPEAQ